MRDMKHGERVDVRRCRHTIRFSGRNERAFVEFNILVLPLGPDHNLNGIFPPVMAVTGSQTDAIEFRRGEGVEIDLDLIPAEIHNLMVVLYVMGGPSRAIGIDHVGEIVAEISGELRFALDTTGRREAAVIMLHFYRRNGGWRVNATGQGFSNGIPGVNRAYNINLDVPDAKAGSVDARDSDFGTPPDPHRDRPPSGSTAGGSGFAVAPRLIITNHHVIEDARDITVHGNHRTGRANVIAQDPRNDIALLSIDHDAEAIAQFSTDLDVDLAEDVTVAGFPLQGLLGSGPQISAGNISALTGIAGDSTVVQFNAPIGSGNSGGPMIDNQGRIVGLVSAALNSAISSTMIAQNINFGVKAAVVRSFLHAAGLRPYIAPDGQPISRAEIARQARGYLYRITVHY